MTKILLNDHFIANQSDKMIPMRTKHIEREPKKSQNQKNLG